MTFAPSNIFCPWFAVIVLDPQRTGPALVPHFYLMLPVDNKTRKDDR